MNKKYNPINIRLNVGNKSKHNHKTPDKIDTDRVEYCRAPTEVLINHDGSIESFADLLEDSDDVTVIIGPEDGKTDQHSTIGLRLGNVPQSNQSIGRKIAITNGSRLPQNDSSLEYRTSTPPGHLHPWSVARVPSTLPLEVYQKDDHSDRSTQFILRNHTENLMSGLKSSMLQLARRDMEIQRLIDVNNQLGEGFSRLRTQYADLVREHARLRQRHDVIHLKGMEIDRLRTINEQLERKVDELRTRLATAEEQAHQASRNLGRIETELRENVQEASCHNAQINCLQAELDRKDEQINALLSRQYMDAAREMQARLLLDELLELKGTIRVIARCHKVDEEDEAFEILNNDTLVLKRADPSQSHPFFQLHRVFPAEATQQAIFNEVKYLITSCVDGYSGSILAFGESSSGKTYTMLGVPKQPGIIPRVARELLNECEKRAPTWSYRISMAAVQVFKESVFDLLNTEHTPKSPEHLARVQTHDNGRQILLGGATEVEVNSEQEIMELLRKARICRQSSATLLNTSTSHLHFILIFRVRGLCKVDRFGNELLQLGHEVDDKATPQAPTITHGLLTLCDLAGFECWKRGEAKGDIDLDSENSTTKQTFSWLTSNWGIRLEVNEKQRKTRQGHRVDLPEPLENQHLGRSLITLSRVFESLAAKNPKIKHYIPFRDSKLTHILKPTLTGDARCALIVTVRNSWLSVEASLRSLCLAKTATSISLGRPGRNSAMRGGFKFTNS